MLIVALVLAVIGLSALVAAVLTGNELLAWVCIAASAVGVLLLVADAIRERQSRRAVAGAMAGPELMDDEAPTEVTVADVETPGELTSAQETTAEESAEEDAATEDVAGESADEIQTTAEESADEVQTAAEEELAAEIVAEDHPEEIVHDEPDYDMFSDDEADYPAAAEEAAMHTTEGDSTDVADETDLAAELAEAGVEAGVDVDVEAGDDARTAGVSDDDAAAGPR